jgi:hypothetical protein
LGLGGVGETPETRWSRPPVTVACWPTVGAPSGRKMEWEVVKSGGGSPPLYIVPGTGRSVTPKPIGEAVWRLVRVAGWATHRYAVADG